MNHNLTIPNERHMPTIARILTALVMTGIAFGASASVDPDQMKLAPPAGDGWQVLSSVAPGPTAATPAATLPATPAAKQVAMVPATPAATPVAIAAVTRGVSLAVAPVVLTGDSAPAALTFTISPQDINLRNALDRWLQLQGWQLAWKIDDDLPLEFNATFTGDFTSVLTQVMRATNHMRTPTRVCRHTNHVIRVVARAASCKD